MARKKQAARRSSQLPPVPLQTFQFISPNTLSKLQ